MGDAFLRLLNMSITAGWLILVVLLLRLLLKKAPGWIVCGLWALVAARLLLPFSLESVLSLIPSANTIPQDITVATAPAIDSGIGVVDAVINPVIADHFAPSAVQSGHPVAELMTILASIWALGALAMAVYALVSNYRLYWQVRIKVCLYENIFISDDIQSPFVLGIRAPKIYLPSTVAPRQLPYIVAHEQAHLQRLDHIWKALGFAVLCLHWFNPLVWVGYILMSRDIEGACDEKVICKLCPEERKAYAQTLLTCSTAPRRELAAPLAFGELAVKKRIRAILEYRQPRRWVVAVALVVSFAVTVCFLTNPVRTTGLGAEPIGRLDSYAAFEKEMAKRLQLQDYYVSKYTNFAGTNTANRYVYSKLHSNTLPFKPEYYQLGAGQSQLGLPMYVRSMGDAGWRIVRVDGNAPNRHTYENVVLEAVVDFENEAGFRLHTRAECEVKNCLSRLLAARIVEVQLPMEAGVTVFGSFDRFTTVDTVVATLGYPQSMVYEVTVDPAGNSTDVQVLLTYQIAREANHTDRVVFTFKTLADDSGEVAERLTAVSYDMPV